MGMAGKSNVNIYAGVDIKCYVTGKLRMLLRIKNC
jgi:hypothetical protein